MSQSKAEREATNALLRQYGYRWRKHENDEEDIDLGGLPPFEWVLHDTSTASEHSYGTVVTVREAMEAIAAQGNEQAKEWLTRHPQAGQHEDPPIRITRGVGTFSQGEQVMTEQHGLLVVLHAGKRWIPDDGWSFGLFDEQGWLYQATCRQATPTEVRAYEEEVQRREAESRHRSHEVEVTRMRAWQEEHLHGLICTTLLVPTPPRRFAREYQENWLHTRVHFDAGWYDTGTTYHRFELEGEPIFIEEYGNARRTWLSPALAECYYQQWWGRGGYLEENGDPSFSRGYLALMVLESACHGFSTFGSDVYHWVFEHVGEQALTEMVRAEPPVEVEHGHYALASKWYRLPIRTKEYLGYDRREGYRYAYSVGYGRRGLTRGSNQDEESWEREQRLQGWVALGEEEQGRWPIQADLEYTQAWSQQASRAFSSMFGG